MFPLLRTSHNTTVLRGQGEGYVRTCNGFEAVCLCELCTRVSQSKMVDLIENRSEIHTYRLLENWVRNLQQEYDEERQNKTSYYRKDVMQRK